jgi:hypothetical protein
MNETAVTFSPKPSVKFSVGIVAAGRTCNRYYKFCLTSSIWRLPSSMSPKQISVRGDDSCIPTQTAEFLNVNAHGAYSYHCALNGEGTHGQWFCSGARCYPAERWECCPQFGATQCLSACTTYTPYVSLHTSPETCNLTSLKSVAVRMVDHRPSSVVSGCNNSNW